MNKRHFVSNLKTIIHNYGVLKYRSKYGTEIQLEDRHHYWRDRLNAKYPTLSDVCKHVIYTWCHISKVGNMLKKYEMIPTKWHVRQAQCFLSVVKQSDIDYEASFTKYGADRLYTNTRIFEKEFKDFVERYMNPEVTVKTLDRESLSEAELTKYMWM